MSNPYLSVVIPSYNEAGNLRKGILDKIDHYLSRQKYSYEVIVIDDGSDDGSAEFVEKFAFTEPERYWHYLHHLIRNSLFWHEK